MKRVITRQLN